VSAFLVSTGVTLGLLVVVAVLTWGIGIRLGRWAVVDVMWGLGFVLAAFVSFVFSSGHGDDGRRWLVLALTTVWGLRLAIHIGRRQIGAAEDPRYAALVSRARGSQRTYALRSVFLLQAGALWFVSLPVQVAAQESGGLGVAAYIGVVVWLLGVVFEAVGDAQLTAFRGNPSMKGQVLETGLWRYTRHPNYFGDACVWWGLFLVACDRPVGWLTVLSPLLMTWFLARKTGAPLMEAHLSSTRPGYAAYVVRTSGFIPRPPRRA
jgi:steroid 5-alpha reductase family enzyme